MFDRQGHLVHTIKLPYRPNTGITGDGRSIFLGMDDPSGGRFMSLATKDQPYQLIPEWVLMPPGEIKATPTAYQGTVFLATRDGAVIAVRADDRGIAWPLQNNGTFMTGGPIYAGLAADKDGVYVASADTKLYCLDLQDGHVRWSFYAGRTLGNESTPVPTANSVYMYMPEIGLVAIDKTMRQEIRKTKWIVPEARQFLASDETFAYPAHGRQLDHRGGQGDRADASSARRRATSRSLPPTPTPRTARSSRAHPRAWCMRFARC